MTDEPAVTRRPARPPGVRLEPDRDDRLHPELDAWRRHVGAPIAFDVDVDAAGRLHGLDVLCWNIAIGLGRLEHVLEHLRAGAFGTLETSPARPLVILLQEAFRLDPSMPDLGGSRHHGGQLADGDRHDIARLAARCGLSLRYSPSMRNGRHTSDRGNAILATARLDHAHAFILPYVRQRRVVVTATLAGHADLTFISAHLDTHGRLRRATDLLPTGVAGAAARRAAAYAAAAGREIQARALARAIAGLPGSVILGADLNSILGDADPAVAALVEAGLRPARRAGTWRHTFHARVRLLLDHVLYRSHHHRIAAMDTFRLDEVPGDRSATIFGSDHHPLLARVTFS